MVQWSQRKEVRHAHLEPLARLPENQPGCQHCYVYAREPSVGRDASVVAKTGDFDLPLRRDRRQ